VFVSLATVFRISGKDKLTKYKVEFIENSGNWSERGAGWMWHTGVFMLMTWFVMKPV
jgi:hypothetical protein